MEITKQLTDSQKRAIEIVQKLAEDKKIEFSDAFRLIVAIYENEKEFVYVPYNPQPWITEPYTTIPNSVPWRDNQNFYVQADPNKPETPLYCYAISGTPKSPWNIDFTEWIG